MAFTAEGHSFRADSTRLHGVRQGIDRRLAAARIAPFEPGRTTDLRRPLGYHRTTFVRQPLPKCAFPLIPILRQCAFIWGQFPKKRIAFDTLDSDPITFYVLVSANELTKVLPTETSHVLELSKQQLRIECVSGLPQFENHQPADQGTIERLRREGT